MMEEDYVSFETAKLMKEKGFNWNTDKQFNDDKIVGDYNITDRSRHPERYLDAPTLQMAMKWLREKYNIHVVPKFDFYSGDYTGRIYDGRKNSASERDNYIALVGFGKYEEAADAAIKYCLKILI